MGSFLSQPLEPIKVAAPPEVTNSAEPLPLAAPGAPTSPAEAPLLNNCWSCRVLSGSGLIGAGGYVYWVARKPMKLGYAPSPGTITQMVIGISESRGISGPLGRGIGRNGPQSRGRVAGLVTWPRHTKLGAGAGRGSSWDGVSFLSFFF